MSSADEIAEAIARISKAQASGDLVAMSAAMQEADKVGVDQQEMKNFRKVLNQLQKEKRDLLKRTKSQSESAEKLVTATSGDIIDVLQEAIKEYERVRGISAPELSVAEPQPPTLELEAAYARLKELQTAQLARTESQQLDDLQQTLADAEYFIAEGDVEAAMLTIEDATAMGADAEEITRLEGALSELRERLDPEAEARRRRLEARSKQGAKKWNYSGKTDNKLVVNDRFREHEEELQRRRTLAYRGRGRLRGDAEDDGDDAQEKHIRKERAEVNAEKGFVAAPKLAQASSGFVWGKEPKEASEAPRRLTMRAHIEMGAGVDFHASWWGMVVDIIDDQPGQPGLRLKDVLVDVNGTSLRELDLEDCEQRFADFFGDGSVVTVEPHVELPGMLTNNAGTLDRTSLEADLERFAQDWGAEVAMEGDETHQLRIVLKGAQSAVKPAKAELENLLKFYAGTQS